MNRRDVVTSLPFLAGVLSVGAAAQSAAPSCTEPELTDCKGFRFEEAPVRYSSDGAKTRQFMEGHMPGLNIVEVHETTIAPGKAPHPPHRHPNAEFFLVREGMVEFITDNAPMKLGPGSVAYCAPNKLHGIRNVGAVDATYFVMKIGAEPVCQK